MLRQHQVAVPGQPTADGHALKVASLALGATGATILVVAILNALLFSKGPIISLPEKKSDATPAAALGFSLALVNADTGVVSLIFNVDKTSDSRVRTGTFVGRKFKDKEKPEGLPSKDLHTKFPGDWTQPYQRREGLMVYYRNRPVMRLESTIEDGKAGFIAHPVKGIWKQVVKVDKGPQVSPDGTLILTRDMDGKTRVRSLQTGDILHRVQSGFTPIDWITNHSILGKSQDSDDLPEIPKVWDLSSGEVSDCIL